MELYTPFYFKNNPISVDRFLLLYEAKEEMKNTLFDLEIPVTVKDELRWLQEKDYANYKLLTNTDEGNLNSLRELNLSESSVIYLYTEIYVRQAKKLIVDNFFDTEGKLWVNNECCAIFQHDVYRSRYFTHMFHPGKNTILIQLVAPQKTDLFSLILHDFEFERTNSEMGLVSTSAWQTVDMPYVVYTVNDAAFSPEVWVMLFSPTQEQYKKNYTISIYMPDLDYIEESDQVVNTPIQLKTNWMNKVTERERRYVHLEVDCTVHCYNGTTKRISSIIRYKNFENLAQELIQTCQNNINKFDEFTRLQVEGWMKYYSYTAKLNFYNEMYFAYRQLLNVQKGVEEKYSSTETDENMYFIHSNINLNPMLIRVIIPENYNPDKPSPALYFAAADILDRAFSDLNITGITDSCLIFDITGYRVIGGSYIGETGMLEALTWIHAHYNIDESREYLVGESEGGYATWALAQNYPHYFSGIYPLSGMPELNAIENTTMIPTYQIYSPHDPTFRDWTSSYKEKVSVFNNYHEIEIEGLTHAGLRTYLSHKEVLRNLLSHQKEIYPRTIFYYTVRNRHIKSYWILLHGIVKGMKYAEVRAKIIDKQNININLENSEGLTISIPPEIDRSCFTITINESVLKFTNYESSKICLEKRYGDWTLVSSRQEIDYTKGTGILDVYLGPVKIIIKSDASEIIKKIARNFASPLTNVNAPYICVQYPIISEAEFNILPKGGNYIYIVTVKDERQSAWYSNLADISCGTEGFSYNKKIYVGDYVVLQVMTHPRESMRSVLLVSTNNEKLLLRNLFTRNVVLPFYSSGIHPYLNNRALVYYEGSYLGMYEKGDELQFIC